MAKAERVRTVNGPEGWGGASGNPASTPGLNRLRRRKDRERPCKLVAHDAVNEFLLLQIPIEKREQRRVGLFGVGTFEAVAGAFERE